MEQWVGRDQGLEGAGADVIQEGDLFVFEVDCQHVVDDVEDGHAVGGQLDDHWLMDEAFVYRSQPQLALVGHVETYVANVVDPQAVDVVVLVGSRLAEYLLAGPAALQPETFCPFYPLGQYLILSEVDAHLPCPEPVLGLRGVELEQIGTLAVSIGEPYQQLRGGFVEETMVLS